MLEFQLNSEQIFELINNKRVKIGKNKFIEFLENELIINSNGNICYSKSLDIKFENPVLHSDRIQKAVCNHLNLEPVQVLCTSMSIEEAVFRIKFSPQNETEIIVCLEALAKMNTAARFDNICPDEFIEENQIGYYHRLGNSEYFFRWNDL